MIDTKMAPVDFFREIGIDTYMRFDRTEETIFFIGPRSTDSVNGDRRDEASPEAVAEFIAYWSRQIQLAAEYLENGRNPNTHEWGR